MFEEALVTGSDCTLFKQALRLRSFNASKYILPTNIWTLSFASFYKFMNTSTTFEVRDELYHLTRFSFAP